MSVDVGWYFNWYSSVFLCHVLFVARSFRADNIGKLVVMIIEGSDLIASDPNGT